MLHLVAEQYDFPGDGMEYGLLGPERIAQLEQEDLERYQQSVLQKSSYHVEPPDYQDELQSKLLVLMEMMGRFCNDSKGLTSPSENGSEEVLPQPVSNIYDGVACAQPQTNEVSMADELPDSEERKDFHDKKANESLDSEGMLDSEEAIVSESAINSQFSVNPSLHKQLMIRNSGIMVLSIYCAHMAPRWNIILETRPKQKNDMSVEVYYTHFIDWKKKLEGVNYMGDEDSYIDDFLYGLKRELAVKIWEYKWKPYTLYGAFRRAQIVETLMKNDADIVLEEMPLPNSIYISTECSLIEDDSKPTHHVLPIFGKMVEQNGACKVFTEMPEPILEKELLGKEVTKTAHYMLDERLTRSLVHSAEDLYGKKVSPYSFPYIYETGSSTNGDVSYEEEILGVTVDTYPSLSKLGFNPQVFDPGTHAFFKQEEYASQLNENERQLCCKGSEFLLNYTHVCGEFRAYNHLVTEFRCHLFECANNRDKKIDWDLNTWNSWEVLLRNCNVLLWKCQGPLVDFHAGALAQMCTAYDQPALTLGNGYDIGAENSKICFTPGVMPVRVHRDSSSTSFFEGENFMFMSNFLYFWTWFMDSLIIELRLVLRIGSRIRLMSPLKANFKGDDGPQTLMFDTCFSSWHLTSRVSINSVATLWFAKVLFCLNLGSLYNDYDLSLHRDIQIHVFLGAKVMFIVKMISFWILFSDGWIDSLGLACNYGTWLFLLVLLGNHLAWDPGICAIFAYILEDKDVFKRVGKRILAMVMIRSVKNDQIKIRMIRIEEGFSSMMTWRNGTTCAPTIFISPDNHVLDRHSEVPKLLNKTGPTPTGSQPPFTLFSSIKDYYIDSMLRDAWDDHWLFDETVRSFPIKLNICVGPNKDLRLLVVEYLKYLRNERCASEASSTKFLSKLKFELNINFWLDAISIFGFYPGTGATGANEGQWNAYKGHVNVQCIVAFSYGINDHLVRCCPFDPGGCRFPEFDCDPFESVVPSQVHVSTLAMSKVMALYMFCLEVLQRGYLDRILFSTLNIVTKRFQGMEFLQILVISPHNNEHVQILDTFFLCQYNSIVKDVIGHLRSSYDDAKDGYLQHMEPYGYKDLDFWFCAKVPNACPTSASAIFASYDMYGLVSISNLQMFLKALVFVDASMSKTFEMASFPISCTYSCVAHTNVVQDAVLLKIFIWDPGVGHFTTLRTRRLSRGRRCYESSLKLFKDYYIVFKS